MIHDEGGDSCSLKFLMKVWLLKVQDEIMHEPNKYLESYIEKEVSYERCICFDFLSHAS